VPEYRVVCLTGFMGSGKSTVGRLLAAQLAWHFSDLDAEIESESGLSISQIFAQKGEIVFREIEHECLARTLGSASERNTRLVLALGGGTVEDESTRSLLIHSPGNCLVFLHAELTDLLARCTVDGKTRPLLAAPDAMEARHNQRLPHYQAAHLTVTTTGLAPQDVADRVRAHVSRQWLVEAGKR